MNDTTIDQTLRAADPFADARTTPRRRHDPALLLATILEGSPTQADPTQADPTQVDPTPADPMTRPTRRRSLSWVAAAAVVTAVVGAMLTNPFSTSEASALVAAAQRTEVAANGRVSGEVRLTAVPYAEGSSSATFTLLWSGSDFDLTIDDGEAVERQLAVGDSVYTQYGQGGPVWRDDRGSGAALEDVLDVSGGGASTSAEGLVGLMERTDDLSVSEPRPGIRRYRGTLDLRDFARLDRLPPGASFFAAGEGLDQLPRQLAVTADVADGALAALRLHLVGETAAGRTDVLVTTTFAALGTTVPITAPGAFDVGDADVCRIRETSDRGTEETAGCADLLRVVDRFAARNPGHPCLRVDRATEAGRTEYARCLDRSDESEVAQAYRSYQAALAAARG